ncbi:MAG: hypothetical protein GEU82_18465 [Luteitalea sp.]|nr:hypothetical protein [Luteitalea sp.]
MPIGKLKKRAAARKNEKKKKTPAKKHVGDVLGLGNARPPSKPVKSAGKSRRPKGIEITPRKRSRTHLRPARVRG